MLKKYFVILFFVISVSVFAQQNFLSGFVARSWSNDEILSTNTITNMIQDHFGYIYLGSYIGLIKFDGLKFTVINKNTTNLVNFISARVVFEDSKYRLWVGSNDDGVCVSNEDRSEMKVFTDELPSKSIRSIIEGTNGDIWIGTSDGVVVYTADNELKTLPMLECNGQRDGTVVRMYCDKYGVVWVTTSIGNLYRYSSNDNKFIIYRPHFLKGQNVSAVFEDSSGYMWFGLRNNSVYRIRSADLFTQNDVKVYYGKKGLIGQSEVNCFMEDQSNNVWVGTDVGIIYVANDGHVEYYTETEGLQNNSVSKIIKDREDNIWISSFQGGIEKLTKVRFHSVQTATPVNCITEEYGKGRYWVGTDGGLLCFRENFTKNPITEFCDKKRVRDIAWCEDGTMLVSTYSDSGEIIAKDNQFITISEKDGLTLSRCRVAIELSNRNIVIGTAKGLNIVTIDRTQIDIKKWKIDNIKTYTKSEGLTNDFIMCLYEDKEGNLWIGTDGGGINIIDKEGKFVNVLTDKNGLAGNVIFKICQDKNDIFWINTGSGMTRYDKERNHFYSFNRSCGLQSDSIFQIIIDKSDVGWMTENGGLCSVPMSQLNDMANGKKTQLEIKQYNKSDGLLPGGVTSTSYTCIDSRGCLLFPMINGFSFYNPYQINKTNPPLVYIEKISTGDKTFETYEKNIEIPATANRITIDYAGLSFVSLERIAFRYQLIGFDSEPSPLTTQRQVSYTNLKPGKYTFSVSVVNGDGVWSTSSATIDFVKKVYYYQTVWFWILIVLVAGLMMFLYFTMRMHIMKRHQIKLEKIIAEKTQALRVEMEKSENLLLNILPKTIAEKLKDKEEINKDEIIADSFPRVSVLFADIVGFTEKSSHCSPKELILWLNDLFSMFDVRASMYKIEKIKTIGDSYMAACGVPEENENHAINLLNFARGILEDIEKYNEKTGLNISMRIGISSGAITAGVIGKTKFIYDIWGDTVNVASRMEHYGKESMITVSASTYDIIKNDCKLLETEEVEVKGKGRMQLYRVS